MRATPDARQLYDVVDATWPAARSFAVGPFLIREGKGGGKRVSAATALGPYDDSDIARAEEAMTALGQGLLFQLREGEEALDATLAARGYDVVDPVIMYVIEVEALSQEEPPRTAAIPAWEPLKIMEEIWAAGGVGPERIDVMRRAEGPKTGMISRWNDKPAGASFLAMHEGIGMVHSLEILPHQRRQGVAQFLMRRAAIWVQQHGGTHLSVICTTANEGANALYASLGMRVVGQYHYRQKTNA
ncbi:GNAT family N-acetyltransferase [Shimia sp.]|uniref:GNAT family N-acetyltransferase n=1 Tax=Shimia sp. TaxID=1954381 RepID=UPI003BAC9160